MKGTETGKDKVKKICEALRRETLEPAMQEAEELLKEAREKAEHILSEAHKEAERVHAEAKAKIEREKVIFQAALTQASKQAVQYLKQLVEEKFFNRELSQQLVKPLQNPQVLADLISSIVQGVQKEGVDLDLSAYISSKIPARAVNDLLTKEILNQLKEKSVLLASIGGGVEVKLRKENVTLDLSDLALKELIANYIRKDFREIFFDAF
ncbi:MAG: V-type ATP synthase subunit E [Chlamydiales bacterium]